MLLGPNHKAWYFNKVLDRKDKANVHRRQWYKRDEQRMKKRKGMERKGNISVGVQCQIEDVGKDLDKVFII